MILGLLVLGGVGTYQAVALAAALPPKYISTVLVNMTKSIECNEQYPVDPNSPTHSGEIKASYCVVGSEVVGHGSGVIIDATHVATARHVAQKFDTEGTNLEVVDQDGVTHKVISVELSNERDFALMEVDVPFTLKPAKLYCDRVKPGEKLFIVGYPLELGEMIFEVTAVSYYDDDGDGNVLLASGVSLPGNSGGPVYNSRGQVVGFLVGEYAYEQDGSFEDSDVNIIIPTLYTVCERRAS